ncbi:MAG: hypothetical protein PHS49_06190 [Candidatus Gracilibacteria bacterium]|nr:hypothetical protein [Candidatus Gracilibacteria bacterium]
MSEKFVLANTDNLGKTEEPPKLKTQEYLDKKEALCNSTKAQLSELKSECSIEKSKENESNLQELLDKTINEVIKNYLNVLNSEKGIDLSKQGIYNDVLKVLDGLSKDLSSSNIFKSDIDLIKNNFFIPKDKGLALVDFAINEHLSKKHSDVVKINQDNIDGFYNILESSFATLYDVSINKSPEQLDKYIDELQRNPKIKDTFEKFPDLKKIIFQVGPSFLNSSSKEVFMSSLHTFLNSIRGDIIKFGKYLNGDNSINFQDIDDSKLSIINNSSKFLSSLLNEESVDKFTKNIVETELVSKNPTLLELMDIINKPDFPKSDKLLLSNKILEGIELFSTKDLKDESVNDYISSLLGIISSVSKNIDNKDLLSLIKKMRGGNENDIDVDLNLKDLGDFLWKNKSDLIAIGSEVLKKWFNGENISLNKLIIELLKDDVISKNFNSLGTKLIENLRKITKIDLTKYAVEFRKKILEHNFDNKNSNVVENDSGVEKIEKNLIDGFSNKVESSVSELVNSKLNAEKNNKLNKDEIIKVVLNDLKLFLGENSNLVFEYAKELGFKVDGKSDRKNILKLLSNVLENPKLLNVISKIIENIGKNIDGKGDIIKQIDLLIKETINNKGGKLLSGIGSESRDMITDTFYDEILGNRENISTLLNVLGNDFKMLDNLDKNSIEKITVIFKKYVGKEKVRSILDKVDVKSPFNNLRDIGIDIYNSIHDKTGFINELLENGIIETINEVGGIESEKSNKIDKTELDLGVDLLYSTLESTNNKDLSITLNNILKKIGLNNISDLTILGKNVGENIVSFLKSVDSKDFKMFLNVNKNKLFGLYNAEFSNDKEILLYSNLSIELFKIVDLKKFQNEYKGVSMDSKESLALDLSDEFVEVINEKGDLIQTLTEKGIDLYNIYTGKIDINQVNPEMIKMYGRQVFDLLNSVVSKIDSKYLENNIKIEEGENNKIVESFLSSFMGENKWFLVKEGISGVFNGFDFNLGSGIDSYFRDVDANRDNFGETLYSFLDNKN